MHLLALMMGIALQAPAGASPAGSSRVDLYSACDASSDVVAQVPRDASFKIHYSIADAPPTCDNVSVTVDGKTLTGFLLDLKAPAALAFDQARVVNEQEAFKRPLPVEEPPERSADTKAEAKTEVAKAPAAEKKPAAKPAPKMSM